MAQSSAVTPPLHRLDPVLVFGALGHAGRLQIVDALSRRDHCVQELVELVGSSWSTVSRHLAVLREAGVVRDERRGAHIYYSLALECVASFSACLRAAARGQRVEVRTCCE
jgi:ArsR family transcriptional regulator